MLADLIEIIWNTLQFAALVVGYWTVGGWIGERLRRGWDALR